MPMELTLFVCAKDVMRVLSCSQSAAYRHLRVAAGKTGSSRAMLRVSVAAWEQYAATVFAPRPAVLPDPAKARAVLGAVAATSKRSTNVPSGERPVRAARKPTRQECSSN